MKSMSVLTLIRFFYGGLFSWDINISQGRVEFKRYSPTRPSTPLFFKDYIWNMINYIECKVGIEKI